MLLYQNASYVLILSTYIYDTEPLLTICIRELYIVPSSLSEAAT